jgi:hypothetical protein
MTVLEFAGYAFVILIFLILSAIVGLVAGMLVAEALDAADDNRS